jgi:hypothetical protein
MAESLPGPYEIEFNLVGWLSPTREHVFRVSCLALGSPAAGSLPTAIDIQKMGGSTAKLNIVANQFWEFLRQLHGTGISCNGYQLWRYVTGTLAKDFVSAGTVTNPLGTGGAGTGVAAHQNTLTFRSANGGVLKLVILEGTGAGDTRTTLIPNVAGTPQAKLAAYILSADNVAIARDDSYPVAALRDSRGQNERIWRLLYRS